MLHRSITIMAAFGAVMICFAQVPFALDTTFRTGFTTWYVNSVLPVADGKVLASGWMIFPELQNPQLLARLNGDGTRDDSFPIEQFGQGKLIALGDKLYVGRTQIVSRIFLDGQLDPSWAEMNTTPYFSSLQGGDYHVFPDGRVVMSGYHNLSDSIRGFMGYHNFIWFSNEGYLDTTRVHRTGNGVILNFGELPDGKFICSGTGTLQDGMAVDKVFRLHSDGSVDTTFHSGVISGRAFSYSPQENGKVLVSGLFQIPSYSSDTLHFVRFNSDGSIDPTFNNELQIILNGAGQFTPLLHTVMADGNISIHGSFDSVDGMPFSAIALLDPDGNVVSEVFSGGGCGPYTYQGSVLKATQGIIPYGDDHYLIWGAYHGYDDGTIDDPQQRFVTRLHKGDFTLGVEKPLQEPVAALRLHPNPASNWVVVNYDVMERKEGIITMKDVGGRVIETRRIGNGKGQLVIDTRTFGAGIYTVELSVEGRQIRVEKLIVQ